MTSLKELLETIQCPTVVKITHGNIDIPYWMTFGLGKCLTIFPPAKQIIVLNPSCYENMKISGNVHDVVHSVENVAFLNSKTSQKFYDNHCENVTYTDTSQLAQDFPRYIKADADFFTFHDDENMNDVYKVTAGRLLECCEIQYDHSSDDQGLYGNVRGPKGEIIRCKCKEDNAQIVLPHNLKVNLLGVADKNHYSITEISERFSFPRQVTFCNDAICHSMKRLRNSDTLMAASLTNDEMLFLCELGKTNIEFYDESLLQCKDVVMTELSKLNITDVMVDICEDACDILERFDMLYSKKQKSLNRELMLYTMYGTETTVTSPLEILLSDDDKDDDGDDYLPMLAHDLEDSPPPVPRKPASLSGGEGSRSSSIRSSASSRSSGSDVDHGGSYIHITPTSTSTSLKSSSKQNTVEPAQHPTSTYEALSDTASGIKQDNELTQEATTIQDSSKSIKDMGVTELCEFLKKYRLTDLSDICESQVIDGEFITSMSDNELRNEPFCMKEFDLKKYNKLKDGWRPKL